MAATHCVTVIRGGVRIPKTITTPAPTITYAILANPGSRIRAASTPTAAAPRSIERVAIEVRSGRQNRLERLGFTAGIGGFGGITIGALM